MHVADPVCAITHMRWFQRTSVQVALVTGGFAVVVAVIGLVGRAPSTPEPLKVASPIAAIPQTVPTNKQAALDPDRNYTRESIQRRISLRGTLRPLTAAESSLSIQNVPQGTFGFAAPFLFKYSDFKVERVSSEYSDHAGRVFQLMPAACSDSCRPSIPTHAGHPLMRYETGVVDYGLMGSCSVK